MAVANELISSSELLEECLKRADQEFFPKLFRRVGQFIDVFNHDLIQEKLVKFINGYTKLLLPIRQSETVFEIMRNIRELITYVNEFDLLSTLQSIISSGFDSVLNTEEFSFFDDEALGLDTQVKKFLNYIQERREGLTHTSDEPSECMTAFDEYVKSWRENWQRMYPHRHHETESHVKEMKAEYEKARLKNWTAAEVIVTDIRRIFAPLESKLIAAKVLHYGTAGVIQYMDNRYVHRGKPGWFKNAETYLADYVCAKRSDDDLKRFLQNEDLGEDFGIFKSHVDQWLDIIETRESNQQRNVSGFIGNVLSTLLGIKRNLRLSHSAQSDNDTTESLPSSRGLKIPKETMLIELERLRKFLYAVVLNKPAQLEEHKEMMEKLVKKATDAIDTNDGGAWIPCIAFGQLSIPGENKRTVTFVFLLDPSFDTYDKANQVLSKLAKFFDNIESKKSVLIEEQGCRLFQLHLDIIINDNIPQLIARIIKNLADLSIRGVLVGNFGLGNFRHVMNPTFNRIYSVREKDKAEGFIETWFTGSLKRGEEPYYCPVGWRRYSVDVGKNKDQFENEYAHWPCAYHGSEGHRAMSILLKGLQACDANGGCHLQPNKGAVYLSPSIEYCGHPRYARVWKVKSKYVQMVLQVRIDPKLLFDKRPGTLPGADKFTKEKIDPNFSNKELEWIIHWPPKTTISSLNGILVYGIMLRVTDQHPGYLDQNKWWLDSHKANYWDYF